MAVVVDKAPLDILLDDHADDLCEQKYADLTLRFAAIRKALDRDFRDARFPSPRIERGPYHFFGKIKKWRAWWGAVTYTDDSVDGCVYGIEAGLKEYIHNRKNDFAPWKKASPTPAMIHESQRSAAAAQLVLEMLFGKYDHACPVITIPEQAAALDPDIRESFDERAAIIEFDGGLPRDQAEALALECVRRRA